MSKLAVVINTCAGSTNPAVLSKRSSFGHGRHPYADRAAKLERMLYEYSYTPHEIIVVGEWYADDYWTYVESPGRQNDPTDPVWQRHDGAQATDADFIVFLNDDHYLTPQHLDRLALLNPLPAVTAFNRRKLINSEPHPMETGWPGYVMGHACGMSREALTAVPWNTIPPDVHWDVKHTAALRAAGIEPTYMPEIVAWDIEHGDLP